MNNIKLRKIIVFISALLGIIAAFMEIAERRRLNQ